MRYLALVMSLFTTLVVAAPASAQQAPPITVVRGKIVKLSGDTLAVKTRDGQTADIMLGKDTRVGALAHRKFSDVKDGDFVGVTSMPGKDGKQHALIVHYLPPNLAESQSPWDYRPGSLMTNAHVTGVAKAKGGTDLSVTVKGNTADFVVDRRTTVVGPAPATLADLKPGRDVQVIATKTADGGWAARSVTVAKNRVSPFL